MKVIIFVHTCGAYYESRSKIIQDTWAENRDNVVFITDEENSKLKNYEYIGEYTRGHTYHPENVKKMFQLFLTKYNDYDFFMMIDDDSYVFIDKLTEYLSFFDKDDCYLIGDYLNWLKYRNYHIEPLFDYSKWIGGGSGAVFTKNCIQVYMSLIQENKVKYENHDVWLHDLFNSSDKKQIKRIHCPGFHQYGNNEMIQKYPKDSKQLISIHFNHELHNMIRFHNT